MPLFSFFVAALRANLHRQEQAGRRVEVDSASALLIGSLGHGVRLLIKPTVLLAGGLATAIASAVYVAFSRATPGPVLSSGWQWSATFSAATGVVLVMSAMASRRRQLVTGRATR